MSEAAVTITDKATGSAPGAYNMSNGCWNYRPRFCAQDTWKIKPSLTLNYCLAYMFETGLYNTDLNKPAYLRPIIGKGNLAASEASYNQFSPAFGFAWSPLKSGKTVIQAMFQRIRERGEIGPLGDGRLTLGPTILKNTFPGIINLSAGGAAMGNDGCVNYILAKIWC